MATRITRAVEELAEGDAARMAQVKLLVGSTNYRLRVGDFRVIFHYDGDALVILKIGPRGSIYG